MATLRGVLLTLAALFIVCAARAADDDLRAKALKLNDVTGTDAGTAKTLELLKDADGTKKMIEVATNMAKEKDQPFNVNATFILARAGRFLQQYDASERFYRLNLSQALKLQSPQKIFMAYDGLSEMLFENKKYADSQKVSQEFIELTIDKDVDAELDDYRPAFARLVALCMARQNDVESAKKLLDRLIRAAPDDLESLQTKARILHEANELEASVKTYETILEKLQKIDGLEKKQMQLVEKFGKRIKYSLSGVFIDLKQVDKAAEQLQDLLKELESGTIRPTTTISVTSGRTTTRISTKRRN